MGDIAGKLDKSYESMGLSDLAETPVAALQGVSDTDVQHLTDAFGIHTIWGLGTNSYCRWA
ncbi:hypothetical protein FHX42_001187 [Saccharopolyspora lacisalsi]|uniref:Uncharacterized protein n=1 Tax=Halosaccharopolyspora lacisalsi TaxID=1000566 RepID=A0A839DYM1_9PSEU|nr:hypothetical protein [Halosaccharopolyspora lacisalsi]MBA8823858.1 hypothetical protein [Halosaccharopolyspora lacisalsi]